MTGQDSGIGGGAMIAKPEDEFGSTLQSMANGQADPTPQDGTAIAPVAREDSLGSIFQQLVSSQGASGTNQGAQQMEAQLTQNPELGPMRERLRSATKATQGGLNMGTLLSMFGA